LTKLEPLRAGEGETDAAGDDNEDQSQTAKNGGGNGVLLAANHELSPASTNGNGVGGRANGIRDVEGLVGDVIHV
jgi:hypothetical protein